MRGGWEGEKEITIMIKSKTDKKQQELSSIWVIGGEKMNKNEIFKIINKLKEKQRIKKNCVKTNSWFPYILIKT